MARLSNSRRPPAASIWLAIGSKVTSASTA
jgi:hypothetical protein